MPVVKLGTNTDSLNAQRRLTQTSDALSRTYERLSSGLRINRASDDPAGLALASSLDSDRRVYVQGIRNLNDGISLINVADGAIEQLTNITTRLKELAEQAANGSFTGAQRLALDREAQSLKSEYFRIIQSTEFNDKQLLRSSFGTLTLQAGYGSDGSISSTLGGSVGTGSVGTGTNVAFTGTEGIAVQTGDINGDGITDMVALGVTSGNAQVKLGTGGGGFGSTVSYSMSPVNVAVGLEDVNGDGMLDLISQGTNFINVRLGTGTGSFGAIVSSASVMLRPQSFLSVMSTATA